MMAMYNCDPSKDLILNCTICNCTGSVEETFKLSPATKGIRISIGAIVFIENIVSLVALSRSKHLQLALRYFLVNLSCADMISGIMFVYHSAVIDIDSVKNIPLECKLRTMLVSLVTVATSTTVTAVSVERVVALFKPFRYLEWITKNTLVIMIVFVWTFPLAVVLAAYDIISDDASMKCHFSDIATARTYLILSGVRFGLMAITIVCQMSVLYAARNHIKRIAPTLIGTNQGNSAVRMHLKATLTTALLVVPFTICVLPLYAGHLYLGINPHIRATNAVKEFMSFGMTLYIANGALNPVIYCWRLSEVRNKLKRLCCGSAASFENSTSSSNM